MITKARVFFILQALFLFVFTGCATIKEAGQVKPQIQIQKEKYVVKSDKNIKKAVALLIQKVQLLEAQCKKNSFALNKTAKIPSNKKAKTNKLRTIEIDRKILQFVGEKKR